MYDYMRALYYRFSQPMISSVRMERQINILHKQLSNQLEKPQRKLLLQLLDLQDTLREQVCVHSFADGVRVAAGISRELISARPPYNFEREEAYLSSERLRQTSSK